MKLRLSNLILSLVLVALCWKAAPAQVLRGSVSTSAGDPPMQQIYAGQDPLKGKPEIMPPALQGKQQRCIPPDPRWILVYQGKSSCYYFMFFPQPIQGYVVPINQIQNAPGRCGAHPWDNRYAICDQKPQQKPANQPGVSAPNPYSPPSNYPLAPRIGEPYACRACAPSMCVKNTFGLISCIKSGPSNYPSASSVNPNTAALNNMASQVGQEMNNLRNAGLVAGDHFFQGLGDTLVGILQFLAQPRGGPTQLGKPAEDILNYFTNDYNQNDQQLRAAAAKAVQLFQTDPARFFGQNAVNLAPLVGPAAVRLAESAGSRFLLVGKAAEGFAGTPGFPKAGGPLNPTGSVTNCFKCALAFDQSVANGRLVSAPAGSVVPSPTVVQVLRDTYGPLKLNPFGGGSGGRLLPGTGRVLHQMGVPVASTEAGIQGNLLVAGGGSRGLVFTVDSQGYKHIFNAVNSNGRVYFYDAQFARAGSFAGARQVYFYRTN